MWLVLGLFLDIPTNLISVSVLATFSVQANTE